MYGGFWKNIISVDQHKDLPLGQSDMFFARGPESQPDTVCSLVIFSSQPPKEDGRLD
jgi:hypothetical protein